MTIQQSLPRDKYTVVGGLDLGADCLSRCVAHVDTRHGTRPITILGVSSFAAAAAAVSASVEAATQSI